jgi:hypothetical protein
MPDRVKAMMLEVREKADVEESTDLEVKLQEIEEFAFERGRPSFLMKRPFVETYHPGRIT